MLEMLNGRLHDGVHFLLKVFSGKSFNVLSKIFGQEFLRIPFKKGALQGLHGRFTEKTPRLSIDHSLKRSALSIRQYGETGGLCLNGRDSKIFFVGKKKTTCSVK